MGIKEIHLSNIILTRENTLLWLTLNGARKFIRT